MLQVFQRLDDGQVTVMRVPVPEPSMSEVLVRTEVTTISPGTERVLLEFGRSGLLEKARSQPDKVRDVLAKVRTDGIRPTVKAVRDKLETPIPLGYCNAGVVVAVGSLVESFKKGDRVVTNGAHAEYVCIPQTLVARIPETVPFETAAFTPLGAIALQGIRLAEPSLGETFVVYGLGLIGLLAVQLLRASGCKVIGIDINPERLELAKGFGAIPLDGSSADLDHAVFAATAERGCDGVLLTLASKSDEPIRAAARMSRKRGRIILVGVTGLNIPRDEFFKKELSFQVSCSYGPGRYDPQYEAAGIDYPIGYVRWTEGRNFEAVLGAMVAGQLKTEALVTHTFPLREAVSAYKLLTGDTGSLGVLLRSDTAEQKPNSVVAYRRSESASVKVPTVAVIGAGNFASSVLIPLIARTGARLRVIASASGASAAITAHIRDFERATTNLDEIWNDSQIDTVFVVTRHNSHPALVAKALQAGKHVYVEKPLAIDLQGLSLVEDAASVTDRRLMVGFNRRFASLAREAAGFLRTRNGPAALVITVNAGLVPRDHWTNDPSVGGGRIIGEGCHFIDLARFLVGAPIRDVQVSVAADPQGRIAGDIALISLKFSDGSIATINYLANGARSYPKERVEGFFDSKVFVIDNWRKLKRYGFGKLGLAFPTKQDKGHAEEIRLWMNCISTGAETPIPYEELIEVSRATILAGELARQNVNSEQS